MTGTDLAIVPPSGRGALTDTERMNRLNQILEKRVPEAKRLAMAAKRQESASISTAAAVGDELHSGYEAARALKESLEKKLKGLTPDVSMRSDNGRLTIYLDFKLRDLPSLSLSPSMLDRIWFSVLALMLGRAGA